MKHTRAGCAAQDASDARGWHKLPHPIIERLLVQSGAAVKVYLWLARRADGTSGQCYPSIREIASRTGMSRGHVCRALSELSRDDVRLISIERRRSESGDADVSLYTVLGVAPADHVLRQRNTGVAPVGGGGVAPAQLEQEPRINKNQVNKRAAAAAAFKLPPSLDCDEGRSAFADWLAYRREIRRPLRPTSQRRLAEKWAQHGARQFAAAVEHSIAAGYQGLFAPGGAMTRGKTAGNVDARNQFLAMREHSK